MRSNDRHPLRNRADFGTASETARTADANLEQAPSWRQRAHKAMKGVGFVLSMVGALIVGLYRGGDVVRKVRLMVCPGLKIHAICGAPRPAPKPDLRGLPRLDDGDLVELVQRRDCGACEPGVPVRTESGDEAPIRATLFRGQSSRMRVLHVSADGRWVLVLYRRDGQGWIGRENLSLVPRTTSVPHSTTPALPSLGISRALPPGSAGPPADRPEGDAAVSVCKEVLLWPGTDTLPLHVRPDPGSLRVGSARRTRRFRVSPRGTLAKGGTRFFALPCNVPGSQCDDPNRRFGWASERQLRTLSEEMCDK
jgi:hypothetical protein